MCGVTMMWVWHASMTCVGVACFDDVGEGRDSADFVSDRLLFSCDMSHTSMR